MAKRKKTTFKLTKKSAKWWASLIVAVIVGLLQQQGKPLSQSSDTPETQAFENVSVASVYDGDTFKINLNCSVAVYCEKVPVRVLGVDTPEIKGKTAKEKRLAQKAKAFTKNFLAQRPVSLTDCGRDKYFRLLCNVTNGQGQNLAQELIKRDLGYEYWGGKKSDKYQ
ncbi:MAG: thermonuclease family protein [Elusimicrobiaceae bacterium]|nr:thermonuclease family protein [Elusimicrobiaceae bacterium]